MKSFLLTAAFLAIAPLSALAAPGDLDSTFGAGKGFVTTNLGTAGATATAVTMQSDGKIVAAGSYNGKFCVLRYDANGTLDTTFAGTGYSMVGAGTSDKGCAVAVQSDGAIVVAGETSNGVYDDRDIQIVRFLPDGTLDATFDTDGRVITDVLTGKEDNVATMAIQADGKILVLGYSYQNSSPYQDITLLRYNSDGSLDNTFGVGGKVFIDFGGYDTGVAITLKDDKILVAGYSNGASTGFRFALARYNNDGTPDTTFGDAGTGLVLNTAVSSAYSSSDFVYAMAVQADGKIVLSGTTVDSVAMTRSFLLERYNADGTLDTGFGNQGLALDDVGGPYGAPAGVMIDSVGRILVAGRYDDFTAPSFLLLRYNADGTRDTTFGNGGEVTKGTDGSADMLFASTLQTDGKAVVFGTTDDPGSGAMIFALARYKTTADAASANKAPVVTLNGSKKITTTAAKVTIKGTASDDASVAKVLVNKKPAKGTSSWSYKAALKVGTNKFTITATDSGGLASAPVTLTVKRKAK